MAKKQNIPTITMMRDYGGDIASYIGVDNVKIGETIVEWYGTYLKGRQSKVIIITGTPGAASSVDREKGVNATLKKYPNIVEVARQSGYSRRDRTLPVAEDLLQRHPDVEAVLGFNDEIAMGTQCTDAWRCRRRASRILPGYSRLCREQPCSRGPGRGTSPRSA